MVLAAASLSSAVYSILKDSNYLQKPVTQLTNTQATAVAVAIGIGVALYIFILQKKDSDKTQQVIDNIGVIVSNQAQLLTRIDEIIRLQAKMIEEERARQEKRKQFWVNVAYSHLLAIIETHTEARASCQQSLNLQVSKDKFEDSRTRLIELHSSVIKWYIPKLDRAMLQIADLLNDPSLFDDIAERDYWQFTYLLKEASDYLIDSDQMQHAISVFDARIEVMNEYMKRLEAEMPSKAL